MFKKLLAFPLVLLLLCGCAEQKTVTPALDNISFTAEIDYGDTEFAANASITDGALNLVVTKPQEIKDLILNITKNGVTAEFKGVTYTPDTNTIPVGSVAQVLYDILNDIGGNKKANCNQENCEIEDSVNGYSYEFVFSPSGLPISLQIDDLDLEIEFKNVTVN